MGRAVQTTGGGIQLITVARRMYNRPRTTTPDKWLGGKKRRRSLGLMYIKKVQEYPTPTAHQKEIGGYGRACGAELKGKLKGQDWKTIKMAMGACVAEKAGKADRVPKEWLEVYHRLKGSA